jgi:hypothetical protein
LSSAGKHSTRDGRCGPPRETATDDRSLSLTGPCRLPDEGATDINRGSRAPASARVGALACNGKIRAARIGSNPTNRNRCRERGIAPFAQFQEMTRQLADGDSRLARRAVLAYARMFTARAATNRTVTAESVDSAAMRALAGRVSGIASVGLKAIPFVRAT